MAFDVSAARFLMIFLKFIEGGLRPVTAAPPFWGLCSL